MELTDCSLHTAWIDRRLTLLIRSVGDRNVTQRANTAFGATVHTDDLVFTGVEACVGHRVFTSRTGDGQLCKQLMEDIGCRSRLSASPGPTIQRKVEIFLVSFCVKSELRKFPEMVESNSIRQIHYEWCWK